MTQCFKPRGLPRWSGLRGTFFPSFLENSGSRAEVLRPWRGQLGLSLMCLARHLFLLTCHPIKGKAGRSVLWGKEGHGGRTTDFEKEEA